MWTWIEGSTLIDQSGPKVGGVGWQVNDGAEDTNNCVDPNPAQYSYNYGILIGGLAYIYSAVSRPYSQCARCVQN